MELKLIVGEKNSIDLSLNSSDFNYLLQTLSQYREYIVTSDNDILIKDPSCRMVEDIEKCLSTIEKIQKQSKQFAEDKARDIVSNLTEEEKQELLINQEYGNHYLGFGLWIKNTYIYGKKLPIDIHGMQPEEAVKTLTRLIDGAPDTVYRIRVIHGYHRGNVLQRAIYDEFDYFHTSNRVLRMEGGSNPGITEIVLREW